MKLSDQLLRGEASIAVWGGGAIGGSTAAHFAQRGVRVSVYDKDPRVAAALSRGVLSPQAELSEKIEVKPLVESGRIIPLDDPGPILLDRSIRVHFISIPTERAGRPWAGALDDVGAKLSRKAIGAGRELVVVESTLAPGYTDSVLLPHLNSNGGGADPHFSVAVAPRRDWFVSPEHNLRTLPRVVGACDGETLGIARDVLGMVCDTTVPVSSYRVAELVKALENGFRAVNIAFVDEVARAFPGIDVREAIQAAATKWNFLAHFPGAGIGGYCIPLGPMYLLTGFQQSAAEAPILSSFQQSTELHTRRVAEGIHNQARGRNVLILGLSYKGDLKIPDLSPSVAIASQLLRLGDSVSVHDPLFTPEEVRSIAGAPAGLFPDDLARSGVVVVVASHQAYKLLDSEAVRSHVKPGTWVLDVEGTWERHRHVFASSGVSYTRVGEPGWLMLPLATPRSAAPAPLV